MRVSQPLWERLQEKRLIALLAPRRIEDCLAAYEALGSLGIVLEIALRTDAALAGIAAVHKHDPQAHVLAGTVMTAGQAEAAIAAGASGIVSADYIPEVVAACVKHDVMVVPGGLSDVGKQLVQKAALYGCDLDALRREHPYQWVYKLFPAMVGSHLELPRAWRAVYPELTILYTGGVNASNLGRIVQVDTKGIVCASALTAGEPTVAEMQGEARRWLADLHSEESAPAREVQATAATVVTFGEIMLRLAPPPGRRLVRAEHLETCFGGAEANVAVALAGLGRSSRFVTALPEHAIGQAAVDQLRSHGVDTSAIQRQGERVGLYYLEHGAAQRPSRVIYDRAASAMAQLRPGDIEWPAVFRGARWFHWTGITPALSNQAPAVIREALAAAKSLGVCVSADINYRRKLWSPAQARAVMASLLEDVDLLIGNEMDVATVFGIRAAHSDPEAGDLDAGAYEEVAREMVARFGLKGMATSLRTSRSASFNEWAGCYFDGHEFHVSRTYPIHIVDRVGSGDAFAAGLIHGILAEMTSAEALEFAIAAGCLKHSILGDFNLITAHEVTALVGGDTTGRVRR